MDLSSGKDAPAEMAAALDQEHCRHRNCERPEGEEVENEKGEADKRDHGEEENTDWLSAASASTASREGNNPTQLAIFFDGAIYVYDAVTLEKAQAIILIAAATAAAAQTTMPLQSSSVIPTAGAAAGVSPQSQQQLPGNTSNSLCQLQAELPLARRNSLQRFLEKRHARLVSRAPYPSKKCMDSPGSATGSEASTPTDDY